MIPLSLISRSIGPCVLPIAVFLSLVEFSNVVFRWLSSVVEVDHLCCPVHVILTERTCVDVVLAFLDAFVTLSDVLLEGSFEEAVLVEDELAHTVFFVVNETTHILGSIRKYLLTKFGFLAVFPLPLVDPVESSIFVLAIAVGLVGVPLPLVVGTIGVDHETHTVAAVILKDPDVVEPAIVQHHPVSCPDLDFLFAQENALIFDGGL